jgi:hypothetical protein
LKKNSILPSLLWINDIKSEELSWCIDKMFHFDCMCAMEAKKLWLKLYTSHKL